MDEVIRCESRGGSVVGNDIRSSCLTIQPRPEVKDPSLLTRYSLFNVNPFFSCCSCGNWFVTQLLITVPFHGFFPFKLSLL